MKINDNTKLQADGSVICAHCAHALGTMDSTPFANAMRCKRPSRAAGPGIRAPASHFTDRPIGLRQIFCPGCHVLLATEVVPTDEPEYRLWTLTGHPPHANAQ